MTALHAQRRERTCAHDARISEEDFRRAAALLRQLAGIVLAPHKISLVQSRLARRLKALGLDNFKEYLDLVSGPDGVDERTEFVNALTTNLTSFFRERHHFEHLASEFLQNVLRKRPPRVRLWSAGCSNGAEAYSIAMTMLPAVEAGLDVKILATDIDTRVLGRAKRAIYAADQVEEAPPALRSKCMRSVGRGEVEIIGPARDAIRFRRLNLFAQWPMQGAFDAIFCRNVLIYFDAEDKARLVDRFAHKLTPGGFLYLGHSEALISDHPMLEPVGRTIYRRSA